MVWETLTGSSQSKDKLAIPPWSLEKKGTRHAQNGGNRPAKNQQKKWGGVSVAHCGKGRVQKLGLEITNGRTSWGRRE